MREKKKEVLVQTTNVRSKIVQFLVLRENFEFLVLREKLGFFLDLVYLRRLSGKLVVWYGPKRRSAEHSGRGPRNRVHRGPEGPSRGVMNKSLVDLTAGGGAGRESLLRAQDVGRVGPRSGPVWLGSFHRFEQVGEIGDRRGRFPGRGSPRRLLHTNTAFRENYSRVPKTCVSKKSWYPTGEAAVCGRSQQVL